MLHHLRVRNLGILEDASLDPPPGLTVITGETGAGKTLLLGGLRLLLGEKPETSMVGPAGDRVEIDGLLSDGDGEIGVTRIVPKEGNSRAHLDGSIVSASALGDRIGSLVEIVGQHDQLNLRRPAYVLSLIDEALDDPGRAALADYRQAWEAHREALRQKELLGGDESALARELDLVRYQASEIEGASLLPDDDVRLEAEASRLRNLEEITEHLRAAMLLTEHMAEETGELVARMRKVSGLDAEAAGTAQLAEGIAGSVTEVSRELRRHVEQLEADPRRLEEVEQRLTAIGDLKRKYGRTLDDVIEYARDARRREAELEELLSTAGEVDSVVTSTGKRLLESARELRRAREMCAARIAGEASRHLADLGLEAATLDIRLETVEPTATGTERASIWFSSDERLQPGTIDKVASGGELSRLVLAVRLATRSPGTATLVFDEVDAGVGGATALAMGEKLAELAGDTQVLCVSHLPQVAAFADSHHVVTRAGATATLAAVEGEDRLSEVARMLAGLPESVAGHQAAAELLALGRSRR